MKVNDIVFPSLDESVPVLKSEGQDELNQLCPISKLTGHPMSLQYAIKMISDKDSRLADVLLQELPVDNGANVSDDDKFRMIVSRLDTGSLSENDALSRAMSDVVREFLPNASREVVDSVIEQSSSFESHQQSAVENV